MFHTVSYPCKYFWWLLTYTFSSLWFLPMYNIFLEHHYWEYFLCPTGIFPLTNSDVISVLKSKNDDIHAAISIKVVVQTFG